MQSVNPSQSHSPQNSKFPNASEGSGVRMKMHGGMFWNFSAIHFLLGGLIWRLTLSLWLDPPWSARPVGLGDLMDLLRLQGVTFEREKPVIHWFSDFCGSFSRFFGNLEVWSRLSFVGCWPCFWWTRFFWKCWRLRHKFWTPSHLLISWRIGFNTMWVPPPAGAQRDIHADESKDFRILLRWLFVWRGLDWEYVSVDV